MAITTYTELQAAVANWLNRSDLTSRIPEFIALAEARLNRLLNVPEQETTATITADTASEALPADFWEARNLYLDTDPREQLEEMSLSAMRTFYSSQSTGRPQVYAIVGSNLALAPSPDTAYNLILTYKQTIPPLASNSTNWLLTKAPDAYLYGSLLQAEAFGWNDDRIGLWKAAFDEAIAELQRSGDRKRHGGVRRLRSPVAWGG